MTGKITFTTTVTVLSPLHIGTDAPLREGFDFLEKDGYLWIADHRKLLSAVWNDAESQGMDEAVVIDAIMGMTLQDMLKAGWLKQEYFDLSKGLFKYRLRGATSTTQKQGELLPFIKTVYGDPYLPGSGVKGAIRTALAWWFMNRQQPEVRLSKPRELSWKDAGRDESVFYLGDRGKFAAKDIESKLFGRNPNYDLLRSLIVRDSVPVSAKNLCLGSTHVLPRTDNRDKLTIDMEFLRPGTVIHQSFVLDDFLLGDPRADRLKFDEQRKTWLRKLARTLMNYTRRRLVDESRWFQTVGHSLEATRFLSSLASQILNEQLSDNEFFIQLGWGTGWDSKTLDGELRKDEELFVDLINKYSLHKGPNRKRGRFEQGEAFPLTRKAATLKHCNVSNLPLGWVKVRLEEG